MENCKINGTDDMSVSVVEGTDEFWGALASEIGALWPHEVKEKLMWKWLVAPREFPGTNEEFTRGAVARAVASMGHPPTPPAPAKTAPVRMFDGAGNEINPDGSGVDGE